MCIYILHLNIFTFNRKNKKRTIEEIRKCLKDNKIEIAEQTKRMCDNSIYRF